MQCPIDRAPHTVAFDNSVMVTLRERPMHYVSMIMGMQVVGFAELCMLLIQGDIVTQSNVCTLCNEVYLWNLFYFKY